MMMCCRGTRRLADARCNARNDKQNDFQTGFARKTPTKDIIFVARNPTAGFYIL